MEANSELLQRDFIDRYFPPTTPLLQIMTSFWRRSDNITVYYVSKTLCSVFTYKASN